MQSEFGNRPRTKILPQRVTGKITDWKGKFGWIQPDRPIQHPEAKFHKGLIYLSQMDVEAEISGIGANVNFFVYSDGTGLGASNVRPATGVPPVQLTVTKPTAGQAHVAKAAAKAAPAPGQKQRVGNAPITGQVKSFKGDYGWINPSEPLKHPLFKGQIYIKASDVVGRKHLQPGMTVSFFLYSDNQGLGAERLTIVDDTGAQEQPTAASGGGAGAGADAGPRERLTAVPTTGEVLDWRGNFGWVKPHEAVDHPAAQRRQGNVYVSRRDLKGVAELKVGQLVQFHVFVDNSGIGGEECAPF